MTTTSLKVFNPEGLYVAACKHAEDAACLVALYGEGATIRWGHNVRDVVWREGAEAKPASESYDFVAQTVSQRISERRRRTGPPSDAATATGMYDHD